MFDVLGRAVETSVAEDLPTRTLTLPGRTWEVRFQPTEDPAVATAATEHWLVLGFGILASVLLAAQLLARAHSQRRLEQERLRLRMIIDLVPHLIFAKDRDGYYLLANQACADAYGIPAEEMRGVHQSAVHSSPTDVDRLLAEDRAVLEHGERRLIQDQRYTDSTGRERIYQTIKIPFTEPETGSAAVLGVAIDVTEARLLAEQLAHQANHDSLTGLLNRRAFEERLDRLIATVKSEGGEHVLCFLDLNQFKIINDTAGHAAGDDLLRRTATLLSAGIRDHDTVARLGGDEFGLLLHDCSIEAGIKKVEALIDAVSHRRLYWEGQPFRVGAAAGVVAVTKESESAARLVSQSDVACYAAKEQGSNQVRRYTPGCRKSRRRREMEQALELSRALESGRLRLFRQPIVPLAEGPQPGPRYEILLRLLGEDGQTLAPGGFIPGAERYGLMFGIDRWVIGNALSRHAKAGGDERISINLSANSLTDESLPRFVRSELSTHGLEPRHVCFEITETAAITHLDRACNLIEELRRDGCRFALDDVGTGLSSFAYLKALPVDYLKIDGSFVREMTSSRIDQAMVGALNHVAHTMGLETVAESVENPETLESLRDLGVDFVQGHATGSPAPFEPDPLTH